MGFSLIASPFDGRLGAQSQLMSQLSRLQNQRHRTRKGRNAALRASNRFRALPKKQQEFLTKNPDAVGLPRSYTIEFADVVPGQDCSGLNGARIIMGRHGRDDTGLIINNHAIQSKDVRYVPAEKTYYFDGEAKSLTQCDAKPIERVTGSINLSTTEPTGTIGIGDASYAVKLASNPLKYAVRVSHNAGAYANDQGLQWDENSTAWKNADWQDSMEFWYETVFVVDPILGSGTLSLESYYVDKISSEPEIFSLSLGKLGFGQSQYWASTMEADGVLATTVTEPDKVSEPPALREGNPVHTVFPELSRFDFSPTGVTFVGAYKSGNKVYAVEGVHIPDDPFNMFDRMSSTKSLVNVVPPELAPKARSIPARSGLPATRQTLGYQALLAMNPLVRDEDDPSGWRDEISSSAMADFHEIVVYYMDTDLRETFISVSPPNLDSRVLNIARDHPDNAGFYKKLQVPYLASFLSGTTLEQAKNVNGARANNLVKEIPADDPVYKRQSAALYRMRFREKFPSFDDYLQDQQFGNYYSGIIDNIATALKNNLEDSYLQHFNENYESDLATIKAEIDDLAKWATQKKLYWPFLLLYYIETYARNQWYPQLTTGGHAELIRTMRNYNGLFSMLEDDQVNKDGKSFVETLNSIIRMYQMTTIVPQMVDIKGNMDDIDTIVDACLVEILEKYGDTSDPGMVQQVQDVTSLHNDENMRKDLLDSLATAHRLSGALGSWFYVAQQFEISILKSERLKNIPRILEKGSVLALFGAVALIGMVSGVVGYSALEPDEKALFISSTALLGVNVLAKSVQGALRLHYFWKDVGGLGGKFKLFVGNTSVLSKELEAAATSQKQISNAIAKYFVRTTPETTAEAANFARWQRVLGRNIGEFLATVSGLILAVVSLALIIHELVKSDDADAMEKAYNWMFLLSASIQTFAIVGGMVSAAFGLTVTGVAAATGVSASIIGAMVSMAGPLAVALAIIGLLIFVIWEALRDRSTPVDKFMDRLKSHTPSLYMDENLSIEYLINVPATSDAAELNGVSIRDFHHGYMYMSPTVEGGEVDLKVGLDFSPADIWNITTDGLGKTFITTRKYTDDGLMEVLYFGLTSSHDSVRLYKMPDENDPSWALTQKLCAWYIDVVQVLSIQNSEEEGGSAALTSALCTIKSFALNRSVSAYPQTILVRNTDIHDLGNWEFKLQPKFADRFEYQENPWELVTTNRDRDNLPRFYPEKPSEGLTWSVHPPLPSPFVLVPGPGSDEGAIRMEEGVGFTGTMEATEFTVTCKGEKPTGEKFERSSTVVIKVEEAAESS